MTETMNMLLGISSFQVNVAYLLMLSFLLREFVYVFNNSFDTIIEYDNDNYMQSIHLNNH